MVVSTRDCSLQRRHQKLVEEAPAPFLTDDQVKRLYDSSKAILKEAGYVGAGTCEFLVAADGTISFLEVNTRLQVEHCVSEEVTGIDLVREMFRIAAGEELGYDDPEIRGHSIEYRINAEDGGNNFMPAPGTLTAWNPPQGPGVRRRRRLREGRDHPGLVRLPRRQADRHRPRPHPGDRALAPRAVGVRGRRHADRRSPFHEVITSDPAWVGASNPTGEGEFTVYTTWIETDFDNQITPYGGDAGEAPEADERQKVVVEVGGKRLEVVIPAGLGGLAVGGAARARRSPSAPAGKKAGAAASGDAVTSPMQGTIVKIAVEEGQDGRRGRRRGRHRGDEDGAAASRPTRPAP